MASIFSKIVAGDIPFFKVAEDDHYLAFLDINPLQEGHTLVIPKKEVDYYFDLDTETFTGLNLFAKKVARAMEAVIPCQRIGMTIIGLEVPHAHIHLIPMQGLNDMNFSEAKKEFSKEEMKLIANKIFQSFKRMNITT